MEALKGDGIPTTVHYPLPLNRQPAVADTSKTLPHGDAAADRVFSLPMYPYMPKGQTRQVAERVIYQATN